MNTPAVSIIMPVYNGWPYVREAVDSVLEQTLSNWELIVVNDGSTDSTEEYLTSLADSRITVIHQDNQGVSVARNAALDIAKGEFITFLDADDVLPPNSLHVRLNWMAISQSIDVLDGAIEFRDEEMNRKIDRHTPHYSGDFLPPLLRLDPTVFRLFFYFYRRSAVGGIRFKRGMTHSEDLLFCIQLACSKPVRYGHVNELVYIYRTGHSSAMKNMLGLEKGYFILLKELNYFSRVTRWQRIRIRLRIARILLLSWGAAGNWYRGLLKASGVLLRALERN